MNNPITESKYRSAFTLLELLVGIALGSLILLVAIATVRTASSAMQSINRTSAENAAMYIAWHSSFDDVDFWRSHADTRFPYGKRFMSDNTGELTQYRPFRPWDIPDGNDGTSNFTAAINPSSWHATHISGATPDVISLQPGRYPTGGDPSVYSLSSSSALSLRWFQFILVTTGPDPISDLPLIGPSHNQHGNIVMQAPDEPYQVSARGAFLLPAGWDPWHITGSYSSIANIGNHAGQKQQWETFRSIGHLGTNSYLEPGSMNLIATAPTNRALLTDRSIVYPSDLTQSQRELNWGEIPFGLRSQPHLTDANDDDSGHYLRGLPGPAQSVTIMPSIVRHLFRVKPGNNTHGLKDVEWHSTSSSRYGGNLRQFGMDLDLATATWVQFSGPPITPMTMYYPNRLKRDGNNWDATPLLSDFNLDPMRTAWVDPGRAATRMELRNRQAMSERIASRTSHVPLLPSDSDAPGIKVGNNIPRVSHQIARSRLRARDLTEISISVQGPDGARPIRLHFRALGTTYRGARQHWGSTTANSPHGIGDN